MINNTFEWWKENHQKYMSEEPFKHWEINGFFKDEILSPIATEQRFQDAWEMALETGQGVAHFLGEYERKMGFNNVLDPEMLSILKYLNSEEMLDFLRHITGIPDLIGDDTFSGGGGHLIPVNGKLGVHIDFSIHDDIKFKGYWRRANVLLYLNKEWKQEWNGQLELWDKLSKKGGKCVKKINPDFNKMIIFGTLQNSWHGHPIALKCPEDRNRISLATYYYSKQPSNDKSHHSTLFAENDQQIEWYENELDRIQGEEV